MTLWSEEVDPRKYPEDQRTIMEIEYRFRQLEARVKLLEEKKS